jgi:hypothetical protein
VIAALLEAATKAVIADLLEAALKAVIADLLEAAMKAVIADLLEAAVKAAPGAVLDPLPHLQKTDIDVLDLVIAAKAVIVVISATVIAVISATAIAVTIVTAVISATVILVIAEMAHPPQQALHHLDLLPVQAHPPLAEAGEKEKLPRMLKSNKKVEKRRTVMDLLKSNAEADGSFHQPKNSLIPHRMFVDCFFLSISHPTL